MPLVLRRTPRCAAAPLAIALAFLGGCSAGRYVTPGGGVKPSSLSEADIQERLSRQPAAAFPARLAVARIQAPGYRSYSCAGYGEGRYSVVTTREIETDAHFARVEHWPMVAGVAPLNRMVLPPKLDSDRELRLAAASLKTDLLLAYSLDSDTRTDNHDPTGLTGLLSLGLLPTFTADVTTTASAAIFDVRTGYIYGVAEGTASSHRLANAWTRQDASEDARKRAETSAFEKLLAQVESVWKGVVEAHAGRPVAAAHR